MNIIMKFKKIISIFIISNFIVSFVVGPTAANTIAGVQPTEQYNQIFNNFMLPYSFGQITAAHYGATDRVLINIQDLHSHPKVQKNISNIIELFDKKYGVNKVFLEGAYGQVSTKWISDNINKRNKTEILDMMLDTGRLTGAEYYSAKSDKTEIIKGLEKKEPYLDNLKRFGQLLEEQDKVEEILKAISDSTKELKKKYYDKRQFKIEQLSKDYKENKITSKKYYTLLSKHIDKLGIDINKYENTLAYIMLLELQKNLDYGKITRELQNLIYLLKEQIPYNAYKMLIEQTDNFKRIDSLYAYIIQIVKIYNLDLSANFSNLDKYFRYIELSKKINPIEMISEEDKLRHEINTRFSETKAQRDVVFLIDFEKYLRDYITTKITSDDYKYYKENINSYIELYNKYADNRVLSLLDGFLKEVDNFYSINSDRNIYFTDNMFNKEEEINKIEGDVEGKNEINKIIENMKQVKNVDIVVTGGFHSQTVTEILKNQGVSYIVITPNVTDGVKLAEQTYHDIVKEQSKISFQTLASLILSLSKVEQIITLRKIFSSNDEEVKYVETIIEKFYTADEIAKANKRELTATSILQNIDRKIIDLAKILQSDDAGTDIKATTIQILRDRLGSDFKDVVNEELLDNIDSEKIKKLLEDNDILKLQKVITTVSKDSTIQQAAAIILDIAREIQTVVTKSSIDVVSKIDSEGRDISQERESSQTKLTTIPTKIILKILRADKEEFEGKEATRREKIINFLENWQIMLGIFFPFVSEIFIKKHGKSGEENARKGVSYILKHSNVFVTEAINDIPHMNFVQKIVGFVMLITRKDTRADIAAAHIKWNRGLINQNELKTEKANTTAKPNIDTTEISDKTGDLFDKEHIIKNLWRVDRTDIVTRNKVFQTAINFTNSATRNDAFKVLDALIKNVTKYNGILFSKQQHDILFEKVMDVVKNNYLSQEDKIKLLTTVTDEIKGFKINESQRNEIFDESLKLINEKGMDDCIELIISVLNSAEVYDKTKINKLADLLLKSDIFDNLKNGMLIFLLLSKIDFFTEDNQREILKVAINYSEQNIDNKNIFVMVDDILDSLARSFSMLDTKQKNDIFALAINRSNNWREFGSKSIYTLFALVRKTKELNSGQQEILYKQINGIFDRYTSASTELFEHLIDAISYDDFVKLNDSLQSKVVAVIDILIDNISDKKDVYRIDEKVVKLLDKLLQKKYFMNERQKNRLFGIAINLTNKYKFSDISKTRLFEVLYENIEMFSQRQQNKINKIIKKMGVDKFSRTKIEDYFYSPIVAKIRSVANKVENKYKFFRITDLSFAKRAIDKEAKDFFQAYKNLEIENLKALNLLMNLSSKNDIEHIKESLKKMFYYYKQLSVIFENQKEIVNLGNLLEEFFNQEQMDISNQKVLHGYDINSIFNANKEDITINDLINVLHQSSITNFKKINSSINKKRTFEKSVAIQNFSKDGYVNPEIKKLLSKIFEMEGVTVCFDEDTLIISVIPIDRHSTTIIVNVGNINRGISFSLYDGIKYRDLSVESMLKKIGFAAEFNGGFLVNGRLDKTSGLTEDIDLTEKFDMLLKMFYLTVKADEDSFSLYGLEDYVEKYMFATDNNLHQKETHALYDVVNEFYIYVKENYAFNTINNLNEILKKLGLPEISEKSEYLYEEPKTHIKFLGQMGIDRYFNRVIERAFAEGKIVIDETGSLVKNNNFDEMANVTDLLNRINDDDILSQATIIDELNKQNEQIFNLQTKAKVGQLEYQEGYLQLSSGEYIFVKVLKNPINGMIRYAKAEIILSDGQRDALTAKALADEIREDGYRIKSDVRKKSERERKTFLTELNADSDGIMKETTEVSVFGKLMGGQRASVVGRVVFDSGKVKKGESILFKEYLEPNDMDGTINANGIVLTSGAELSHQGLIVKEKGILATIIKDIKFVKDKNGKTSAKIRYVTYKKGTNLEGFSVQEIAEEKEVVIEEGAGVKIDGQTGSLIILNEKEYKEESAKYKSTAKIEQIESQEDQSSQSNQEIEIEDYTKKSISEYYIKSFADIKGTIKEFFGTKATNLQEMFNVIAQIIKEKGILNVEVPDGVMIGAGAFLKILQKKEGFNKLYKEYRQAIRAGNLNVAKEKARKIIEIIDNLTKEDLEELEIAIGKYIDLEGVYAVRSAFIGEDGKKFSSAGVGESVVGVAGQYVTKNLINVVLKSAFSERSVAYQCSNRHEFIPAALVQVAVDSKKSAVMMVRDGKITISGSLGQGEIVVSGKKAQSIIEADVVNGEISISDYVTERQDYQYGLNGTVNNVSDEDATAEIFSEDEIMRMCKTGLALREKYGYDSDIEIAIDENGKIYVVQIRPITSIDRNKQENDTKKDINQYLEFKGLKITAARFERVLEYLRNNNYEITEQTYEYIQYLLYVSAHDVDWTIFFHPELVESFFDLDDNIKRNVYDFCKQNEGKIKGGPEILSIIINVAKNCDNKNLDEKYLDDLLNIIIKLVDDKEHKEHFMYSLMNNKVSMYFLQYYIQNKDFFVDNEYKKLITYLIFSGGTGIEQYVNQTYSDNSNFDSELKLLLKNMVDHKIYDLNMFYNGLTMKIYFHPIFKNLIVEEYNKNKENLTPLIRYRTALAIAESLSYQLKDDKINLLDKDFLSKIMFECVQNFVSKKRILSQRDLFSDESDFVGDDIDYPEITFQEGKEFLVDRGRSSNTGLIGICNNELNEQGVRKFSLNGIGMLLDLIKNKPRFLMNLEIQKEQDVKEAKEQIFKTIEKYPFFKKKYGLSNLVVVVRGHGEDYNISLVGTSENFSIGRTELAKALLQAYKNGANLEEITLDLSACNSYAFCKNLCDTLESLEQRENLKIMYPNIITAGGKEIKYAIGRGVVVNGKMLFVVGNEILSIYTYIKNKILNREKINKYLTLDDVFNSEIYDSNHRIFISGQDVEKLNIDFREKLIELLGEDFIFKDREQQDEVSADYRLPQISSELTTEKNKQRLAKRGIDEFSEEGQRIINRRENWKIVLGALFPTTIGTWFAREHLAEEDKQKLTQEQQEQKVLQIQQAMSIVLQQALNGPIIHFARNLAIAHTKWNLQQDSLQQQTISQKQEIFSQEHLKEQETILLVNSKDDIDECIDTSEIENEGIFGKDFRTSVEYDMFENFYKEKNNKNNILKKIFIKIVVIFYPKAFIKYSNGFILGYNNFQEQRTFHDIDMCDAIAKNLNLCTWGPYYDYYNEQNKKNEKLKIEDTLTHLERLMEDCEKFDKTVYVMIPPSLVSLSADEVNKRTKAYFAGNKKVAKYERGANVSESVLLEEIQWIAAASTTKSLEELKKLDIFNEWSDAEIEDYVKRIRVLFNKKYVKFIFNVYDYINIPDDDFYNEYIEKEKVTLKLAKLLNKLFIKIDLNQIKNRNKISNLAKLIEKIFNEEINLKQPVKFDQDNQKKQSLIENIILEYFNLFGEKGSKDKDAFYDSSFDSSFDYNSSDVNNIRKDLKEQSVENLEKYLRFLKDINKYDMEHYYFWDHMHTSYFACLKYTENEEKIRDFIFTFHLADRYAEFINDGIFIKSEKEIDKKNIVVIETEQKEKYSIEIPSKQYDRNLRDETFTVKNLDTGVVSLLTTEEILNKFSIVLTYSGYLYDKIFVFSVDEKTKVYFVEEDESKDVPAKTQEREKQQTSQEKEKTLVETNTETKAAASQKLLLKSVKMLADWVVNILKLGEVGRGVVGSVLAGIVEFVPMMFMYSAENFVRLHYPKDVRETVDLTLDSRVKTTRILKATFYATTLASIALAIATPIGFLLPMIMSLLSGILPHQLYDLNIDRKIAKARVTGSSKEEIEQLKSLKLKIDTSTMTRTEFLSYLTGLVKKLNNGEKEFVEEEIKKLKERYPSVKQINVKENSIEIILHSESMSRSYVEIFDTKVIYCENEIYNNYLDEGTVYYTFYTDEKGLKKTASATWIGDTFFQLFNDISGSKNEIYDGHSSYKIDLYRRYNQTVNPSFREEQEKKIRSLLNVEFEKAMIPIFDEILKNPTGKIAKALGTEVSGEKIYLIKDSSGKIKNVYAVKRDGDYIFKITYKDKYDPYEETDEWEYTISLVNDVANALRAKKFKDNRVSALKSLVDVAFSYDVLSNEQKESLSILLEECCDCYSYEAEKFFGSLLPQKTQVSINYDASRDKFLNVLIKRGNNIYSLIYSTIPDIISTKSVNKDRFKLNNIDPRTEPKFVEKEFDIDIFNSSDKKTFTITSNKDNTEIYVLTQKNISDKMSSLNLKSTDVNPNEDERTLNVLKKHLKLKDSDIETIFLDGDISSNESKVVDADKGHKLLVIYPLSKNYNLEELSIEEKYVLYKYFEQIFNSMKEHWDPYVQQNDLVGNYRIFVLQEFIRNAIVHGNSADLSKPIYIKYDENGFVVYNVYNNMENATNKEKDRHEEMLKISAAADLSGVHQGLELAGEFFSLTDEDKRILEIKDENISFYAIGVTLKNESVKSSGKQKVEDDVVLSVIEQSNNWQKIGLDAIYDLIDLLKKQLSPLQENKVCNQLDKVFDNYDIYVSISPIIKILTELNLDEFNKLSNGLKTDIIDVGIWVLAKGNYYIRNYFSEEDKKEIINLLLVIFSKKQFINDEQKNDLFENIKKISNDFGFNRDETNKLFKIVLDNIDMFTQDQQKELRLMSNYDNEEEQNIPKINSETKIENVFLAIKMSVLPHKSAEKKSIEIVTKSKEASSLIEKGVTLSENLVLVQDKEQAGKLRSQGINSLSIEISHERGGSVIGETEDGTKVRVKVKDGKLILCVKKGKSISVDKNIMEMLKNTIESGRKIKGLENLKCISYSSKTKEMKAIINTIKNTYTDSVTSSVVKWFDFTVINKKLSDKISQDICNDIKRKTGYTTIMITKKQAEKYAKAIEKIKGFTFIVAEDSEEIFIKNIEDYNDVSNKDFVFDVSGKIMSKDDVERLNGEGLLDRIRTAKYGSKNGVAINVVVKFNSETVNNIAGSNIYAEYGITPMVPAKDAAKIPGKKIIYDFDQSDDVKSNDIVGYVINDAMLERVKNKKDGIRGILETFISENTPEKMYKKGSHAAQSSKFDYTITNLAISSNKNEPLARELLELLAMDVSGEINESVIRDFVKKATAENEKEDTKKNTNILSSDSKTYLEYLNAKAEKAEPKEAKMLYAEMLGFIRGIVLNTIAKQIVTLSDTDIININTKSFIEDKENNIVQAILIMTLQQLANGRSLERLFAQTYLVVSDAVSDDTKSAEQTLKEFNEKLDKVLRENETRIDISENNFDGIPDLLMDRYRPEAILDKGINVSVMSVRSILRAA